MSFKVLGEGKGTGRGAQPMVGHRHVGCSGLPPCSVAVAAAEAPECCCYHLDDSGYLCCQLRTLLLLVASR